MSLEDAAGVTLSEALSAEATRIPELPLLLRVLATWRSVPSFAELLLVGGDGGAADGAGGGAVTVGAAGAGAVWSVGVCAAAFGVGTVAPVPF
jgi:hypothetical protein